MAVFGVKSAIWIFINNEIIRIYKELFENQNINVLYNVKKTKFGLEKYNIAQNIEEIKNVPGIGDSVYEKIKDYITI